MIGSEKFYEFFANITTGECKCLFHWGLWHVRKVFNAGLPSSCIKIVMDFDIIENKDMIWKVLNEKSEITAQKPLAFE